MKYREARAITRRLIDNRTAAKWGVEQEAILKIQEREKEEALYDEYTDMLRTI
jgi:hypothetical protein